MSESVHINPGQTPTHGGQVTVTHPYTGTHTGTYDINGTVKVGDTTYDTYK